MSAVADDADLAEVAEHSDSAPSASEDKTPLYWRALRLRHLRPNGWQRALFVEGGVALAAILVLADAASAWTLLVLPVSLAVVVKANDALVGLLRRPPGGAAPQRRPGRTRSRRPTPG